MRLISIGESLYNNSKLSGDKTAVRCAVTKRDITHKELFVISTRVSNKLTKLGVKKGDRLILYGLNSIDHIVIYAASAMGGFVTVPISPSLTNEEQQRILNMTTPTAVVGGTVNHNINNPSIQLIGEEFIKLTNDPLTDDDLDFKIPPNTSLDDDWAILFTSGTTTGKSKGVARSQASSIGGFLTHTGPMSFDSSVVGLVAFPLHGISSFFFAFLYLYIGGSMVIYDLTKPDRSDLRSVIINYEVTYVTLSPAIMTELIKLEGGCEGVKTVLLTGATSRPKLRFDVQKYFSNSKVFDVYGSTEAGMISMLLPTDVGGEYSDSVGFEPPGTSLCKIKDLDTGKELPDGEIGSIWVSTPMMFTRYILENPDPKYDLLFDGGYFNQGDLGCRKNGRIFLTGRIDDMLVMSSGHCMYPAQLEARIATVNSVKDCFILGHPSNMSPEKVICLLVVSDSDRDSVSSAVAELGIKEIDVIQFISPSQPLPRTPNGKVIKVNLRAFIKCP
eukprot:TRINITY_DN13582_c0_g1_i1.p1 TRINITY_DN13582_c0_g1~~TRINITY_DN13582_c0_g1_i1.p1  ORF type:complete len:502 (+),score=98.71 TRINITY_DN13582_c0_g1_i1:45-1550(+)